MDSLDFPQASYLVACRTEGCENAGVEIVVLAAVDDPQVTCGPCAAEILDVKPYDTMTVEEEATNG